MMGYKGKLFVLFIALAIIGCAGTKDLTYISRLNRVIVADIENPIQFRNGNLKEYEVSISNETITKIEDSILTVLVDTSYQTRITLRKGNSVKQFDFRVRPFPKPKLWILTNGKGDVNDMTAAEFRTFHNVAARLADFDFDCVFKVESMEINKIKHDGTQSTIQSINPKADWTQLARTAQQGDTYIFRNIMIRIKETDRLVESQEFTMYLK